MYTHHVTFVHWAWCIGMGLLSLALLFSAAESIIKGKLQAPSVVLAGFLILLAAFTMSLFLSVLVDLQTDRLDTFRAISGEWNRVVSFLHYS